MGAAARVPWQLTKTDRALWGVEVQMPGQVGADPVRELLLNGACIQCLGLLAGYKADPAFPGQW